MTIPNYLTLFRLACAPVLLVIAWFGMEEAFLVLLAVAFITDAIDGPIARWTDQESELGPKLDTWADVSIYLCGPIGAWWLWPELIMREILYFMVIVASIILPMLFGFIKFHGTTSYHTWLVKIAAVCTTVSSLLLFLELTAVPFRISAIVCALAGLEEVLITLITDKSGSNVRSLWHVMRETQSHRGQRN